MVGFEQTISDLLCVTKNELIRIRTAIESMSAAKTPELTISIPENGGSVELQAGDNIINYESGTLNFANGDILQLEQALNKTAHKSMHSFAIAVDEMIHYRIVGQKTKIINGNYSDQVNNIIFNTVIITCDRSTNIQCRASTILTPVSGVKPILKIDSSGIQSINIDNDDNLGEIPYLYNIAMASADLEYSQELPSNTKMFEFRGQEAFDVRYAYETGIVALPTGDFGLLKSGEIKTVDRINLTGKTVYFACGTAAKNLQLECWV